MNKPTKEEIEIIDKIILQLNNTSPPSCAIGYGNLKLYVLEIADSNIKEKIDAVLIAENLCSFEVFNNTTYKLTESAKEILYKHGSYSKYLRYLKKQKIISRLKWWIPILITIGFGIYKVNTSGILSKGNNTKTPIQNKGGTTPDSPRHFPKDKMEKTKFSKDSLISL